MNYCFMFCRMYAQEENTEFYLHIKFTDAIIDAACIVKICDVCDCDGLIICIVFSLFINCFM